MVNFPGVVSVHFWKQLCKDWILGLPNKQAQGPNHAELSPGKTGRQQRSLNHFAKPGQSMGTDRFIYRFVWFQGSMYANVPYRLCERALSWKNYAADSARKSDMPLVQWTLQWKTNLSGQNQRCFQSFLIWAVYKQTNICCFVSWFGSKFESLLPQQRKLLIIPRNLEESIWNENCYLKL